ncbi:hypothetical protein BU25DRAFT_338746 [Macroventuria anomochaeta]|uniref:Uncharacterized protein n=1 Tax=Macroventuria anomochaeta TaxID=301207 RepID=A0ACB6S677_9PLEO|nr:uncharacterized protein BU25DRAFT_338746 [Macroventuria anomochaeta]KAF2628734.1 hypothetical protein BU25DRAFT_338746 [Macroventuria anomochaeta]
MQQHNQTSALETDSDAATLVDTTELKNVRTSIIYQVLPAMVSSHLPTIPSIRRSIGEIRDRRLHSKTSSITEIPLPGTPPPGYTSRPSSGSATPNRHSLLASEPELDFPDDVFERPGSSMSSNPPPFSMYERKTGISWKYAGQGTESVNLLTLAHRESSIPNYGTDETSPVLTRQLYLHGMTYLLRGLPSDLTPEELLSLQTATPQSLVNSQADLGSHALVPRSAQNQVQREMPSPNPSILHRITATLVLQTFVLIQFLLPYIRIFISHAYQFEREHQITRRVVNGSITTVDDIGRRSLRLSQTICQMNDGKVGQAINEMTIWWVRGVTGGMQQGFEEGLNRERRVRETGKVERIE